MNAITHRTFGGPDVLRLDAIDAPRVGAGDVLVRVRAAGVNPGDSHRMRGVPYVGRLAGYGLRRPKRTVLGTDLAGRVEAVGDRVARFRTGDLVLGWGDGAFAEYASVREDRLVAKPANLTFEQAAAVPTAAVAALQGLRDGARIRPGQHVLILGASGGVGTFAVQIAKAAGAQVSGVTSARDVDLVRSVGADRVIDDAREGLLGGRARYHVILDLAGDSPLREIVPMLTPTGTYVVAGARRFAAAIIRSPWAGRRRLRPLFPSRDVDDLATLRDLAVAGRLLPVIDRRYGLAETAAALCRVETGHARGKVVISLPATGQASR